MILLEALAILVALGALIALFLWMLVSSIEQIWHAGDAETRRDRARPWVRDV